MANETTTTTATEAINTEAILAAADFFESNPGVVDFVTVRDISGQTTNTGVFPIIDRVAAAAIAEGTDFTTNSAIDTSGSASATVSEHIIKSVITDMTTSSSTLNLAASAGSDVGRNHARGMQKLQDTDITGLFGSFDATIGDNTGAITTTLFINATSTLDENDIPTDRRASVLHPTQMKGFKPAIDDASVFGRQGQEVISDGSTGRLYGTTVFQTTAVQTVNVGGSSCYAGAVMHVSAVGVVTKDGRMFESQRDASLRATEVMLVSKWGQVEYRGGATTNGRGGAGVEFYSNTTN